jgi:hypothetical protein
MKKAEIFTNFPNFMLICGQNHSFEHNNSIFFLILKALDLQIYFHPDHKKIQSFFK